MGIDPDGREFSGIPGRIRLISFISFGISALYYLVTAGLVLPLYLKSYNTLGTDKSFIWIAHLKITLWIILTSVVLFLVSQAARFISKDRPDFSISILSDMKKKILPHEVWTVLFAICVCISYMLSDRKDIAYLGEVNWYIGAWEYIAMCVCILVTGRTLLKGSFFTGMIIFASLIVYEAGIILDLVGENLGIEGWNGSKVSTIGNGNWFCGYLVCVLFVPAALYMTACLKETKNSRAVKALCLFVFFTGSYCFFTQGSASAYPASLAVICLLLLFCAKDLARLKSVAELMIVFSVGGLVHAAAVKCGVYERSNDGVTKFLDGPAFLLFLLAASLIIIIIIRSRLKAGCDKTRFIAGNILIVAAVSLIAVYIPLLTFNTVSGGALGTGPALYFDEDWASSRGMTISAGLTLFRGETITEKLFGSGPDTFYRLTTGGRFPELAEKVDEYFEGARLTNAHCEPVTMLVNTGIAGTVCFYGMLISLLIKAFGASEVKPSDRAYAGNYHTVVLAVSAGIVAYMVNNIFSFQTAMNLSQLSLLMGFGASAVRTLSKTEDK
ncbi:MAG: O-antigen ligase family protein [Lachnospiraceae bacterium]|nr:O-antigen ligase family protein [Lachnospiraceae bacterium]